MMRAPTRSTVYLPFSGKLSAPPPTLTSPPRYRMASTISVWSEPKSSSSVRASPQTGQNGSCPSYAAEQKFENRNRQYDSYDHHHHAARRDQRLGVSGDRAL